MPTAAAEGEGPPTAESDPFLRALLERFGELNPYLAMFAYKEIGDGYLAPPELYRRIASADYLGRRPSLPQLEGWIRWMEWLGALRKVGFRHKFTPAGTELGQYLIEIPPDELLAEDEDASEVAAEDDAPVREAPGKAPGSAERGAVSAAASAATDPGLEHHPDDLVQEFDDDELADEGLDLPPSVELVGGAPEDPYWKDAAQRPGSEAPPALAAAEASAEPSGDEAEPASARPQGPTGDAAGREEPAEARAAPQGAAPPQGALGAAESEVPGGGAPAAFEDELSKPGSAPTAERDAGAEPAASGGTRGARSARARVRGAAPAEARASSGGGGGATALPANPSPEVASEDARLRAQRLVTEWWLARSPRERPLSASGVSLRPHPSGKPVALFKLLVLATLLEAGEPAAEARALFAALEADGALESFLVEQTPLEELLERAWAAGASARLVERLVHLARFRRGLEDLGPLPDEARAAALRLRERVCGDALGPGLLFVLRELAAGGTGPTEGLDSFLWLPPLLEPED